MHRTDSSYDVVVIGAGHAGCEAALAAARAGGRTLVVTPNLDRIGFMPCNPSIGGPGKSQIVAEVDALGGAMGIVADRTSLQARELNTRKGPAVRAVRVQCDKSLYAIAMKEMLETQPGLEILQDLATGVVVDPVAGGEVRGVQLQARGTIDCRAIVVTAGTFLRARMISGESVLPGGRAGDGTDSQLSASLADIGLRIKRFKTGTPPRLDARTIDVRPCEIQPADDIPLWMSRDGWLGRIAPLTLPPAADGIFANPTVHAGRLQLHCYQTHTTPAAHDIIRANLERAPMYNGGIEGTGPRYCPSIEDKISRFAHKDAHPIYIEPEGWRSHEAYIQGLSTSLPADVQQAMLREIPGLQEARITRFGYAVEYDALDATELLQTLECRRVRGLFMAGQVNGTSGYEEAAGQGIIAGANAAAHALGREPLVISRTEGYIGVMIDDLVSLHHEEPYRMLTSRAEYRLILRADTADARLHDRAFAHGLISGERHAGVAAELAAQRQTIAGLASVTIGESAQNAAVLARHGIEPVSRAMTGLELARRPTVVLADIISALTELGKWPGDPIHGLAHDRAGIAIRYGAFIDKEEREAERHRKAGDVALGPELDFRRIPGLRVEAIQRLNDAHPLTIRQAQRTAGVTPGDISAILIYLNRHQLNGVH